MQILTANIRNTISSYDNFTNSLIWEQYLVFKFMQRISSYYRLNYTIYVCIT